MTEREREKPAKGKAKRDDRPQVTAKNINDEDRAFLEEHADGLSRTTVRYARWIHGPDEHEERPGQSLATRSLEVIRAWAEARGGRPATVETRASEKEERPRVLRIDFTGKSEDEGSRLSPIEWEEWFRTFEERSLVFVYQEHKADGSDSTFFRLDSPDREDG